MDAHREFSVESDCFTDTQLRVDRCGSGYRFVSFFMNPEIFLIVLNIGLFYCLFLLSSGTLVLCMLFLLCLSFILLFALPCLCLFNLFSILGFFGFLFSCLSLMVLITFLFEPAFPCSPCNLL